MATLSHWLRSCGLDLKRAFASPANLRRFVTDRKNFHARMNNDFSWGPELPILGEWAESSGSLGGYFLQDMLVARWIYEAKPEKHLDVGSRIDGFIAHLAVFREVEVLDIRLQTEPIPNVIFHQLDLMDELPEIWLSSTDSLSCLHTIEHFGLGRYGDRIDPEGHSRGIVQLGKTVRPAGMFYLSTPIGPQRVEFNAHRIFAAATVLEWFGDGWEIEKFAYLDDNGVMHENVDPHSLDVENHFGCHSGLAIIAAKKQV